MSLIGSITSLDILIGLNVPVGFVPSMGKGGGGGGGGGGG